MRVLARTCLLPALALLACSHAAGKPEEQIACPQKLAATQELNGKAPDGWSVYASRKEHPFTSVSFFSGAPDEEALLAPSKEEKKGKTIIATWHFANGNETYWVACGYAGTGVVLARALSKTVDACTVEYDARFATPVVMNWSCRAAKAR
ncbi:MAG: hypothetical protein JNJ60_15150 [Rhodocyclaceae bacterium]|nr:hypothetical protein [Rhodocyclaceae bacterium]